MALDGLPCAGDYAYFDYPGGGFPYVLTDSNGVALYHATSSTPGAVQYRAFASGGASDPVTVVWKYPTTLVANPSVLRLSGLKLYLMLSGRLTSPLGPLAGQVVTFSASGKPVCSATTNANGDASCGGLIPGTLASILGLGYTASYAGNTTYLPSSGAGTLIA